MGRYGSADALYNQKFKLAIAVCVWWIGTIILKSGFVKVLRASQMFPVGCGGKKSKVLF